MLFTNVLRALPAALLFTGTQATPLGDLENRQATLDAFIKAQTTVSVNGILANIGGGGSKAPGVSAGIVVASPSRTDPDCECPYMYEHFHLTDIAKTGTPGHVMLLLHTRHSLNASSLATHPCVKRSMTTSQLRPTFRLSRTRLEAQTLVVSESPSSMLTAPPSQALGAALSVMDLLFVLRPSPSTQTG